MVKIKKLILLTLLLALIFIPVSANAADNRNYDVVVFVEGKQMDFPDQEPFIDAAADRTYVPIRFVSEALGAEVDWDKNSRTVYIKDKQIDISLTIGAYSYFVNSDPKTLDAPAILEGDRTLVPLRFVSEALGREVGYVQWGAFGRVDIYMPGKKPVIPEPKPNVVQLLDQALGGDYLQPYDPNGDIIGWSDEWLCKIDGCVYSYSPPRPDHYGVMGSDFVRIHYDEKKADPSNKILIKKIAQRFMPDKVDEVMASFDVAIAQFHQIAANKPDIPHISSETGARWFVMAFADTTGDFVDAGIKLDDSK